MSETMAVTNFWNEFQLKYHPTTANYSIRAFVDFSSKLATELAELAVAGTKTATANSYDFYQFHQKPLPVVGNYDIVLDGKGNPRGIIEITAVDIIPFGEVTEEFAYLEGEGDRTLRFWRELHESFFKSQMKEIGKGFDYDLPVICEQFRLVYSRG
ncbi:ASCH domain-containing protein [Radiobacillus sp. PE A8.2]|uniref:ASCH domain-containing protein n=1 Tax=Radiobacillus sp. PE A8.2 TaxID=3380349 RepID=UPI00388E42BA